MYCFTATFHSVCTNKTDNNRIQNINFPTIANAISINGKNHQGLIQSIRHTLTTTKLQRLSELRQISSTTQNISLREGVNVEIVEPKGQGRRGQVVCAKKEESKKKSPSTKRDGKAPPFLENCSGCYFSNNKTKIKKSSKRQRREMVQESYQ